MTTEFRWPTCCQANEFRLEFDDEQGAAKRTCAKCGAEHLICDSDEYWDDASPRKWKCVGRCKSKAVNLCVGFAMLGGNEDVRWLYVAARCLACGTLGCYCDWKIDYGPSPQLLDQS